MTIADRSSQPPSYTTSSHPAACTGTSASCPCINGYACVGIADCHWKCLMTSTQALVSTTVTAIDGSITSATAICVPNSIYNPATSDVMTNQLSSSVLSKSDRSSKISVLSPSVSASWATSFSTFPTFSYQPTTSSTSRSRSTHGTLQSPTAIVTIATITEFPNTCPTRTRSRTVWTTDTLADCSAICPTTETQNRHTQHPRTTRTIPRRIITISEYPMICPTHTVLHYVVTTDTRIVCSESCPSKG